MPALYTFGESASVTQFAYHVCFPTILHKMCKNENYHKIPLYIVYLSITVSLNLLRPTVMKQILVSLG